MLSDAYGNQNNPGGTADDEQPDDLNPAGKPSPVTDAPGTLPNINTAPAPSLPSVGTIGGPTLDPAPTNTNVDVGGSTAFNGQVTDYAPNVPTTAPTTAAPPVGGLTQGGVDYSKYGVTLQQPLDPSLNPGAVETAYVPGWGAVPTTQLPQFFQNRYGSADPGLGTAAQASGTVSINGTDAPWYGPTPSGGAESEFGGSYGAGDAGTLGGLGLDPSGKQTTAPLPGIPITPEIFRDPSAPSGTNSGARPVSGGIVTDYAGPTTIPTGSPSAGTTGNTPGATAGMGNVARTTTDPATALTTQTLSRAPGTDRFALASQAAQDWETASKPQFEEDLRNAIRRGAGRGQLDSGMQRKAQSDVATAYGKQRDAAINQFKRDALTGSIEDSFRDLAAAQQQQGFQKSQQESAFDQALRQALAENTLTDADFNRALQAAIFGYQNNPATTQLAGADIYGRNAANAGAAGGAYGKAQTSGGGGIDYASLLREALGGGGGGGVTLDSLGYGDGYPDVTYEEGY